MPDIAIIGGEVRDGDGGAPVRAGPRSLGELTQGVTTEVFGEGSSMGPLTPRMRAELERDRDGLDYEVCWTRLPEYPSHVEHRGTAQNGGCYASHIRGKGEDLLDAPAEFLAICQAAGLRGEVFHLKAAGRAHWDKMDAAIEMIEQDPATVADRATFADPHQLSVGVTEVLVNGQVTVAGGRFTGPLAGRALAGRGRRP